MPAANRRQKIEALLADDPRDAFLRYSLALELEKEGQFDESQRQFRGLMSDEPPYVPAYFMAAQQLARRGSNDQARSILREGIEQARRQGDHHAAGEMSEFLASLGTVGE